MSGQRVDNLAIVGIEGRVVSVVVTHTGYLCARKSSASLSELYYHCGHLAAQSTCDAGTSPISAFEMIGLMVAVVGLIGQSVFNRLSRKYQRLPCKGRVWRRAFPSQSKQEIREFLALFAAAFGYRAREGLQFAPNDRPMALYRERYSLQFPDDLELETWAMSLQSRYGVSLQAEWRDDITFGEVFARSRSMTALTCPERVKAAR